MQTITKYLVPIVLFLSVQLINAQDSIPAVKNSKNIEMLNKVKVTIENEEREALKKEVEAINKRLESKEITHAEADVLKNEVAKIAALNIENQIAIIDNKIALLARNDYGLSRTGTDHKFEIVINNKPYSIAKRKDKPKKYDNRVTGDWVLAFGLNNAIIQDEKLDDSPYKFAGSRFFEIGLAWK